MTSIPEAQKYVDALRRGYEILTEATTRAGGLGATIPERLANEIAIGRFQALELARAVVRDPQDVFSPAYLPLTEAAIAGQSRALAFVELSYLEASSAATGGEVTAELIAANKQAAEAAGALARSWGDLWHIVQQAAEQPREPMPLPRSVMLGDIPLTLRRMEQSDGPLILTFARALPPHDLLFLRRDITEPAQVEMWLRDAAEGLSETVLALRDHELVGYAAVVSDGLNWTRHVRELRVVVAPSMRGKRLGRVLTEQAFAIAKQQHARKMVAQMTTDQQAAVAVFANMGFEREAVLHNHVLDREEQLHDLQIMSLDVDAFQEKLLAAISEPAEVTA